MSIITDALHHLLETELELMEHFLFSLKKENALLMDSYSNDDLFDLTEIKNQYAERLSAVATQRDEALADLGLAAGQEGLLAAQQQYPALSDTIQELINTVEKARQYNEENGLLIEAYLNYTSEALEALNSANPTATNPQQAQTYDAKGITRVKTNLRRVVKA